MGFKQKAKVKVQGLDEVIKNLARLGKAVAKRHLKRGLMTCTKIVLDEAKAGAAKESGLLKRSIKRKVKAYKNDVIVIVIGPAKGFRKTVKLKKDKVFRETPSGPRPVTKPTAEQRQQLRDPLNYAHLIELGTWRNPARPFLRPALAKHQGTVQQRLAAYLADALEKEAKKRGK